MIKSLTITNYLGESITIDLKEPEKSGFYIVSITGLGPAKANINTTEMSTNDGGIYNSARLNTRNIVLNIGFWDDRPIENTRLESYKFFPIKKPVKILIETDNRIAETIGYVETNEPNIFSKNETAQISIICPDPYFYSAGEFGTLVTTFSGTESLFEFPFSNESLTEKLLEMGTVNNMTENTVWYDGDAETGVIIEMHAIGQVDNVTIYNTGTREMMQIDTVKLQELTGSTIVAGDNITINTRRGNKSITLTRDGQITNILNCLNKNADWFQLAKGDNVFAYTAEYGNANIQFKIISQTVYEGV